MQTGSGPSGADGRRRKSGLRNALYLPEGRAVEQLTALRPSPRQPAGPSSVLTPAEKSRASEGAVKKGRGLWGRRKAVELGGADRGRRDVPLLEMRWEGDDCLPAETVFLKKRWHQICGRYPRAGLLQGGDFSTSLNGSCAHGSPGATTWQ